MCSKRPTRSYIIERDNDILQIKSYLKSTKKFITGGAMGNDFAARKSADAGE